MRSNSLICLVGLILISAFLALIGATTTTYAQQDPTAHSAYAKADAACKALWADHAFDPLRDKFPLGGEKPTFAMLTDKTHLLHKDRPLADLAMKTLEKCRVLYADAYAMLPEQTRLRLQSFDREQDSLIAQVYIGKISIGEYNVGMDRITAEMLRSIYGDVQTASSEAEQKQVAAKARGTQSSSVQQQTRPVIPPVFQQTRLALGSRLIRSTIRELRPDIQRTKSFVPACHSASQYA